jgi:hypothetical protein
MTVLAEQLIIVLSRNRQRLSGSFRCLYQELVALAIAPVILVRHRLTTLRRTLAIPSAGGNLNGTSPALGVLPVGGPVELIWT